MISRQLRGDLRTIGEVAVGFGSSGIQDDREYRKAIDALVTGFLEDPRLNPEDLREFVREELSWSDEDAGHLALVADVVRLTLRRVGQI